jgi:Bacterial protein of unknown function (DUF922)
MAIRVQTLPRITWELFRVVQSIPDTTEEAQINPELPALANLRPERTRDGRFRLPSLAFSVGVNRDNTMVLRTANKTPELLKHEQGHYDLLVLVTRALARELESLEAASVAELGRLVNEARQTHDERAQTIDAEYDKQTNHSRDRAAQQRWDNAITAALANPRAAMIQNLRL